MSAPTPHGQRGGSTFRGAKGTAPPARSARSSTRGSSAMSTRGMGRGRGASTAGGSSANGDGLLQKLRSGTVQRGSENGATSGGRGWGASRASTSSTPRGRGHNSKTFNTSARPNSAPQSQSASPAPASSFRDFKDDVNARFQFLRQNRDQERATAIREGFLADPEKKTTLDKAITPVGTCTEMCPEFERVERMVQLMVDKCEKAHDGDTGSDTPNEAIMVKRFRRSAAGYDEQLPSDIRTPETLKRTMDYLVDSVIGGPERLAVVHKFVWDRTRAIRNDFSIQQVSKEEDVLLAVDCYERIARFHIMSMHQLCNPENLRAGENFDFFQEREQLNNTLLSLMYYYDDNRINVDFPNEAEFRAYCIIFEMQSQHPDLEDRIQSWSAHLLQDKRVETALKLYRAAGNTLFKQGPLRPMIPYSLAQNSTGSFWTVLASSAVPYVMACVAEIYFAYIRFAALDAVWKSAKSAPQAQQPKALDWSLHALTDHLGFDDDDQTVEFCTAFGLQFKDSNTGDTFLDSLGYSSSSSLDKSKIPSKQKFSHTFVEDKRCRRSFVSIINGLTVSEAILEGLVEEEDSEDEHVFQVDDVQDDGQSFFIPESNNAFGVVSQPKPAFGTGLKPEAPAFSSNKDFGENVNPEISKVFGNHNGPVFSEKFGESTGSTSIFGQQGASSSIQGATAPPTSIFSKPEQPSVDDQTSKSWGQEGGLGKIAVPTSGSTFKSPFAPSNSPTTATTETSAPDFSGFTFTKPTQPSTSNSGFSFGGNQIPQPSQPVQAPSAFQPPPSLSFDFTPSVPTPSSQTPRKPHSAFPAAVPTPEETPFQLGPQSHKADPVSASTSAVQGNLPASGAIEEKPLYHLAPNSASSKSLFNFAPATKYQHLESPISPTTALPQPSAQPIKPIPTSKPPVSAFNFTTTPIKPAATPQPPSQLQQPVSAAPSAVSEPAAPSFSKLGQVSQVPEARSTTPPAFPSQQSEVRELTASEKSQLMHHLATLSLCQRGGLLEEFLEYSLPKMLKPIVKQHSDRKRQTTLDRLKERHLQRKYGHLWRELAWRNLLNRKARDRRKRFTQLLNKEAEKRRRLEQEKDEIIRAVEEKKRIQAEMTEMKKTQEEKARKEANVKSAMEITRNSQLAGKKRKSLDDNPVKEPLESARPGPSYRNHKRSRTMGSAMPPPPKPSQSPPRAASNDFRFSRTRFGPSLSRSSSVRDMRRPSYRLAQDRTKTDFFRLLAHGVDPETPWIPLTAAQVAEKERKEKADKQARIEAAYNRRRVGKSATKTPDSAQSPLAGEPPAAAATSSSPAPSVSVSSYDPESDELLQQLRDARKQMEADTEWLREERERMANQIEDGEKLRSSAGSNQSGRVSVNGLPMVNGYEYYPAPDLPNGSMSRVERRIRATGARGFAYKPIGEDKDKYTAVPMSKKTARKYLQTREEDEEIETNGTAKKRRRPGEVDPTYKPSNDNELTEEEQVLEYLAPKRPKGVKHAPPIPRTSPPKALGSVKVAQNPFARPRSAEEADEEYLEQEDEDDVEQRLYYNNGEDGDTEEHEDGEEELLEDSDEEYEEDDYDEDGDEYGRLRATSRPYSDAPTPNTQVSGVSSGIGATAEEPLELSD